MKEETHVKQGDATLVLSSSPPPPYRSLVLLFFITSCSKILLMPSYHSTDLLVHRHWKAVTRHLPVSEWYFDNRQVQTQHTLDYPPAFSFFEAFWSSVHNPVTTFLLQNEILDPQCLQLLSDDQVDLSQSCTVFLRSTVILSDVVLYMGAWWIATAFYKQQQQVWTLFLLIVWHPGLLWLDHVHFQYNGMLLGLLTISITLLIQANNKKSSVDNFAFHAYHLGSAVLFAMLLTLKHLYLTLSIWYFVYLLRRYCFIRSLPQRTDQLVFLPRRFIVLAAVTAASLLMPFLPFLVASNHTFKQQAHQMLARLFPFQRGLLHEYWAANIWALYAGLCKVLDSTLPQVRSRLLLLPSDISPLLVALGVLLPSLLLGAWQAWVSAEMAEEEATTLKTKPALSFDATKTVVRQPSNRKLLASFTYTALASFMTAYHVHEKAILTALLPMTIWIVVDNDYGIKENVTLTGANKNLFWSLSCLLWETTAWGLLGLFPLLFEPRESLLKFVTFTAYLAALSLALWDVNDARNVSVIISRHDSPTIISSAILHLNWLTLVTSAIVAIVVILEFIPLKTWGRWEFAPLALTSLTCACGLLSCWIRLTYHMLKKTNV